MKIRDTYTQKDGWKDLLHSLRKKKKVLDHKISTSKSSSGMLLNPRKHNARNTQNKLTNIYWMDGIESRKTFRC